MFTKIVTVLVVAGLVFGGAAATASAAQGSLPMDALYPIKTLSESVELGLTSGSQAKLEKALEHVQRRVDEMKALGEMGEEVPQHLAEGYAEQVEYALRLATRLSEAELAQALAKIQASLQEQLGAVEQLQAAQPEDTQLAGVAERLRNYLGLVAFGISDPQMFGESLAAMLQTGEGSSATEEPSGTEAPRITETPAPGADNSNTANANDSNTNSGDDANANDSNSNSGDDANANGDDSNSNSGDDANANGDDSNSNDDANGNDDDSNTNGDDSNTNSDDSNTNDDDSNANDDDSNGNGDDDDNSNSNGALLNRFFAIIAWIGSAMHSV